jgi:coatomer protein complex subunit gamma
MKPVQKLAAIRILNDLANRYPVLVSLCNTEVEGLVVDSNCNIATLAITTLLKIGKENNIDRLIKQIAQFMSDIPDEFRVVVVDAIRSLCLKYPAKHHALMAFLSHALRDEGGYEYKKAIVETLIELANKIPESKEHGISYLCEFIEDCEFTLLLQRVLHFLGTEGPKSENPAKCIRFVYNRVMLESAPVRACAVTALSKFAAQVPSLKQSIVDILKRILSDNDDEVRDRAVFYLDLLEDQSASLAQDLIVEDLPVDILSLEKSLIDYLKQEEEVEEFTLSSVVEVAPHERTTKRRGEQEQTTGTSTTTSTSGEDTVSAPSGPSYEELFSKIPQLSELGKPFRSNGPNYITEEDSDYVVSVVKHIYPEHIVFQFNVTNKVETQQLETVHVEMTNISDNEDALQEEFIVEASGIKYESTEACFVCVKRADADKFSSAEFTNVLKFKVRDVDPETRKAEDVDLEDVDEDEYELQEFKVYVTDYMRKVPVSFKDEWDKLEDAEFGDATQFSVTKSLQESVDDVIQRVGVSPMNDANVSKKNAHSLYFSGKFTDGATLLLAVQLAVNKDNSILIKVACRSQNEELRETVANVLLQQH